MEWAKNWVTDKLAGYAATGIQAGGNLAGNAVGGVGSLIENSGRSVGQSANGIAGAVGGVGGYINGYGEAVKNSMAADGPVGDTGYSSGVKKTAVQPSTAVKRTANGTTKMTGAIPAVVKKSLPSTMKAPLPVAGMPSKPPPQTAVRRVLPAKKPFPAIATTKPSPSKPALSKGLPRPPISTSQSERTADGKIKISALSRPQPVKAMNGPAKPGSATVSASSRPMPARAPVSTGQSPRRGDGKIRIAPESRPRGVQV